MFDIFSPVAKITVTAGEGLAARRMNWELTGPHEVVRVEC